MTLHYLQHVPFENPGIILDWARENGHCVTKTMLFAGEVLPEPDSFDWLVIMGGPMNIYEQAKYPWLAEEKVFIQSVIENNRSVVLGLCLGAQLIADVLGGEVTKSPQKEIGWLPVRLTEAGKRHPALSFLPSAPIVFQWHGDTFSTLPVEAELLAESDACAHQAFAFEDRVFGFQFHLENTPELVAGLVENCRDEMIPGAYVQEPEEVLSHPEYIAQDNSWMRQFLTALEKQFAACRTKQAVI